MYTSISSSHLLGIFDILTQALCPHSLVTRAISQECQQLREAGHTQAMGAATMLAESRAREEETIARLQLVEVQSAQEVALANKEVTPFYYGLFNHCISKAGHLNRLRLVNHCINMAGHLNRLRLV